MYYLSVKHTGNPELHQYVLYDSLNEGVGEQLGPQIINLDEDAGKGNKEYTTPKSLMVYLSKIDMLELRPRGAPSDSGTVGRV